MGVLSNIMSAPLLPAGFLSTWNIFKKFMNMNHVFYEYSVVTLVKVL